MGRLAHPARPPGGACCWTGPAPPGGAAPGASERASLARDRQCLTGGAGCTGAAAQAHARRRARQRVKRRPGRTGAAMQAHGSKHASAGRRAGSPRRYARCCSGQGDLADMGGRLTRSAPPRRRLLSPAKGRKTLGWKDTSGTSLTSLSHEPTLANRIILAIPDKAFLDR